MNMFKEAGFDDGQINKIEGKALPLYVRDMEAILNGEIKPEDLLSKDKKYLESICDSLKNFRDDYLSKKISHSESEAGDRMIKTKRNKVTNAIEALKILDSHSSKAKEAIN